MNLSPLAPAISGAFYDFNDGKLYSALQQMASLAAGDNALTADIQKAVSNYFFMLRYMASADDSSSTADDYAHLKKKIAHILALLENKLASSADDRRAAQLRFQQMRPEENLRSIAGDYLSELERLRTDTDALTDTRRRATLERLAEDIFMRLWADNSLEAEDFTLVTSLITDKSMPLHDRLLWISAIGLGARPLGYYARLTALSEIHHTQENETSALAALWLTVMAAAIPDASRQILDDMENVRPGDTREVLAALAAASGTTSPAALTREEMQRLNDIGRRLSDAMRDKPADVDPAEYLPSVLNTADSELLRKFSSIQMHGGDAFSRTLGNMRQDPFFSHLANWFLPFHSENSALAPVVDGEGLALADMLVKVPNLCDGDKYALLLSMVAMPGQLRSSALSQMVDQLFKISDSDDFRDALSSISSVPRSFTIMRHVRNLMRFVKSHPQASSVWPDGITADGLADIAPFIKGINLIDFASAMVAGGHRQVAERIYDSILAESASPDPDILIAAAHNATALGKRDKATVLLQKALTLAPAERNIIIDLASLYAAQGMNAKAFELLKPFAEDMDSDPAALSAFAFAAMGASRWNEAADAFQTLDRQNDGKDKKIRSALVFSLFAGGDLYATSELLASFAPAGSAEDAVCRSAVAWFTGSKNEALTALLPLAACEQDIDRLEAAISNLVKKLENSPVALDNPIPYAELIFIPDILRFKLSGADAGMPIDIF